MTGKLTSLVVAVAVCSGCSADAGEQPRSGVSGTVTLSGGRWPGHPRREADIPITADDGSRTVGRTTLHPEQERFDLRLPPGTYRLQARVGNLPCLAVRVSVPASGQVPVSIICSLIESGFPEVLSVMGG